MIDTQSLSILREIERTGSLTQAADRLHMTQSAVSHAMRRFEERYGVTLWEREGRGIRLTQAGDYLATLAHRLLPQLVHAETVLEDFAGGGRGALRIGMECHPCEKWLMRVITPYLAAWPGVDLNVSTAFQFGGLSALLGHEIDLLITPDPLSRPALAYHPVFDYELVLVVRADHSLAVKPHVEPEDLDRETLITYPVERERLDVFTQFLVPARRIPRRHRTVETSDLMLQLVAAGRGVSAMPDWLVREYTGDTPLRAVRIGTKGIAKSIHIGLRCSDTDTDYIKGFLNLARMQPD
jgi:LysR family transcriptional regulator for metE and metH